MWTAVNWLSQKAGINLEDANEVIKSMEGNNQTNGGDDETSNESSKENVSNNSSNMMALGKRRRSTRWNVDASAGSSTPNNVSNNLTQKTAHSLPGGGTGELIELIALL